MKASHHSHHRYNFCGYDRFKNVQVAFSHIGFVGFYTCIIKDSQKLLQIGVADICYADLALFLRLVVWSCLV